MGDKGETSVNSRGPRHPEWETRGRQVHKAPRVGNKGQVSVSSCGPRHPDKCKLMRPKAPRVGDKGETSVNSRGQRHPEWETRGRQV